MHVVFQNTNQDSGDGEKGVRRTIGELSGVIGADGTGISRTNGHEFGTNEKRWGAGTNEHQVSRMM